MLRAEGCQTNFKCALQQRLCIRKIAPRAIAQG
jgi:hypothetical protein